MQPFFTPEKQQETLPFSDVFRWVEKGCIGNKRVNKTNWTPHFYWKWINLVYYAESKVHIRKKNSYFGIIFSTTWKWRRDPKKK